ncbi:MAG: S8 family peptidase [Cyanobacteriota bacterium]|nr:S8 family peptidase [Cyanobacteriota bacterium]
MKKFLLACLFSIGLGWALFNFQGLAARGTYDTLVLDFREDIPADRIDRTLQDIADRYDVSPRLNSEFSASDRLYVVRGDRQLLDRLRKSEIADLTEYIEPNYTYGLPEPIGETSRSGIDGTVDETANISPTLKGPNDPMYSKQWNLQNIDVESAWQETHGEGITVAVIDTGVTQVPDLKETELVEGYDFVNDRTAADDDNGHGTHVAGTIAQSTNNGYGVAGIAYKAQIMPLKVLAASGGGTISDIAEAIKFAADNDADVINMSLGGGGESSAMKEAIEYAHNKGVVIIAAAGNANQNAAGYPARYDRVIGVSATDAAAEKAPYSNFGAGVDIAAPGGDTRNGDAGGILQNTIDGRSGNSVFAAFQGTSMASPHVAGVAALIKASGIDNPEEVAEILQQSARPVSEDPLNHFGAGHLDAAAAVQLAQQGQITFRDFFRWLGRNGYLNLRFWFDGGAVALLPKILMVLGSYLLAWFLRNYFPFPWSWPMATGLVTGSSGFFFMRGFYVFDLPQWPMRVMGSSIPELGTAIGGSSALNPLFASVLIPLGLVVLFLGLPKWKWFAIGTTLGVTACLTVSAAFDPAVLWLGEGVLARGFLLVNALLCYGLARLSLRSATEVS